MWYDYVFIQVLVGNTKRGECLQVSLTIWSPVTPGFDVVGSGIGDARRAGIHQAAGIYGVTGSFDLEVMGDLFTHGIIWKDWQGSPPPSAGWGSEKLYADLYPFLAEDRCIFVSVYIGISTSSHLSIYLLSTIKGDFLHSFLLLRLEQKKKLFRSPPLPASAKVSGKWRMV